MLFALRRFILLVLLSYVVPAQAADIQVAVASNFLGTLNGLGKDFEARHPEHRLRISAGSTGKLYAQIIHGAPYDVFLAADSERPQRLLEQGVATRPVTYAVGRLVLYAPGGNPQQRLQRGDFQHLAIANPHTAPYGAAARDVLTHMQLWTLLQARLVIGENIGHAFQFVHSGSAQLGFVALAQVRALNAPATDYWQVPAERYGSLAQQAVMLTRSLQPQAAQDFLAYLQSAAARARIEADGYALP